MAVLRAMRPEDTLEVSLLEAQIFSRPWSRQAFSESLGRSDTLFLTALDHGKIAGYIGMYVSLDEGEITNVAVAPGARRRGVGTLLLEELKRQALLRSVGRIILEVRVSNEGAIRLYEKSGFVCAGIRKGFYEMPKEDAYIMIYGQ